MTDSPAASIRVEVVYALSGRYWSVRIVAPSGASVADALALARLEEHVPGLEIDPARLAVFGRPATPGTLLHEGDRIEILRPLQADPKQARRERASDAPIKKR